MKKLIAGNWKMNTDLEGAVTLAKDIREHCDQIDADFLVCPPFVYLASVARALKSSALSVGAQDCSAEENGAHTGDVSAAMLADLGVGYVILGHSERRTNHGETDALVRQKADKAHAHGLVAIICVGETEDEREQGREQGVVAQQIAGSVPDSATPENTVIAYEPVWAIGTGKTATPEDAGVMHAFIRKELTAKFSAPDAVRILYGGSMKPDNAKALLSMPHIDGGLIGGASLDAESFLAIGRAAPEDANVLR